MDRHLEEVRKTSRPLSSRISRPATLRAILRAADAHAEPTFTTLVWLLATTGVRIGEALALVWGNVKLGRAHSSIVIDASLHEAGGSPKRGPTKTKAIREIGIPSATADRLRRLKAKRAHLARDDDYVFGSPLGTPLRQSNLIRRDWHPLLDEAEIPRCGFHRLRHTHASLLIAEGRPLPEISARLGHKNVRTTLAIYAHALPGSDRDVTGVLDQWLARSS